MVGLLGSEAAANVLRAEKPAAALNEPFNHGEQPFRFVELGEIRAKSGCR